MAAWEALGRPLRLGFVGGAAPSAIGPAHLVAARMDGRFAVLAGCFSRDAGKAGAAAAAFGVVPARAYPTVGAMIAGEAGRPDGIEAVAIVTPNDTHHAFASAAMEAGLHVMLDKPVANSTAEAEDLLGLARRQGTVLRLAHAYAGYPMLREARALVEAGRIGALRAVQVEYLGGGLAGAVEALPDARARWRLDPARSGPSLVLGDIGTHAHHLACFVAGEGFAAVSAEVGTLQPGRAVHDYAQLRFRLAGGARGTMTLCQAAAGAENDIQLRLLGSEGQLLWTHARHNELVLAPLDGFRTILPRGHPRLSAAATRAARFRRTGHYEGLHEAFANLYLDFAEAVAARVLGIAPDPLAMEAPDGTAGLEGMRFVAACLDSAARDGAWVAMPSGSG
ncbi:Gfo/Idh/MocA family protein [Falsiroseomonas sp. CW058]|uniref:Gfo/Idh/MocA family protein n=1 Tax=Falsiroseomonas sp. CW058 TaxID=3388664 RepID=UPI003D3170CE